MHSPLGYVLRLVHIGIVLTDIVHLTFIHPMFYPCGWSVVATYPNGQSKTIALLDSRDHAIDYAKGCDSIYAPILERTVYTVKQLFPSHVYS